MSCLLEFGGAGGGGTPAGPSGAVQFNNAGAFGGDSGFTYAGGGQATYTLGTITANAKAVNITGTWNNAAVTFDAPLFMNITNTASAGGSILADFQISGASAVQIRPVPTSPLLGQVLINSGTQSAIIFGTLSGVFFQISGGSFPALVTSDNGANFGPALLTQALNGGINGIRSGSEGGISWSSSFGGNTGAPDSSIARRAAGVLSVQNAGTLTSAAGFQIYNTVDTQNGAPTNFERGVLDWTTTANTLTIGTQKGGTGSDREVQLFGSGGTNGMVSLGTGGIRYLSTNTSNAALNAISLGNVALGWNINANIQSSANDSGLHRAAVKVLAFDDGGNTNAAVGWYQWGGQSRVTADVTFTSTVVLGTVTGLSVSVQAGRTYCFIAELSWTDAAAGGLQLAISGTCTATNIIYDGYIIDSAANGIKGNAQATALGGVVASATTTGTAGHARIAGTITVNAAGTLLVQAAQNTSNATATTIKRGSFFYVWDNA